MYGCCRSYCFVSHHFGTDRVLLRAPHSIFVDEPSNAPSSLPLLVFCSFFLYFLPQAFLPSAGISDSVFLPFVSSTNFLPFVEFRQRISIPNSSRSFSGPWQAGQHVILSQLHICAGVIHLMRLLFFLIHGLCPWFEA